ncbi:hypothetical protein EJ02DRAFT_467846 [Clathrospora elynae]|uniref:Uncharacterized protein n=1 Tax=Clathrospora elynae TaxID=706981 RepID=A0A6A5SJK5_9PLEO|nr:hypothetical protein EJ02DRAFT_467846 [Clathrospora elynae]
MGSIQARIWQQRASQAQHVITSPAVSSYLPALVVPSSRTDPHTNFLGIKCSIVQSICNQNALKIPINSINSMPSVDLDQSIQVELIFFIVFLVDNSGGLNNTQYATSAIKIYQPIIQHVAATEWGMGDLLLMPTYSLPLVLARRYVQLAVGFRQRTCP